MDDSRHVPLVRLAHCGCILDATIPPVGYVFKTTPLGDVQQPVFACGLHYHPAPRHEASEPAVPSSKPRRGRKQAGV